MFLDFRSDHLEKAFKQADNQNLVYSTLIVPRGITPTEDGVWDAGAPEGTLCPTQINLIPYAVGGANSQFTIRVYGWGKTFNNDTNLVTWVPFFLAELLCQTCAVQGPHGSVRYVNDLSTFCDSITVNSGSASVTSAGHGSNLIASARVPLMGCRKFQFDCQPITPNLPMNALWGKL